MTLTIRNKATGDVIAAGEPGGTARVFEGNWYFALEAVDMAYLKVSERTYTCSYKGMCYWIDLETPETRIENFAWVYRDPRPQYDFIKDKIGFYARDSATTEVVKE